LAGMAGAVISTIVMAFAGLGYWSLIWSQFINSCIITLLVYRSAGFVKLSMRKAVVIKSFKLAKSLIASIAGFNTINYWARNSDNLIVGKFYGTSSLGIYNRAYVMLTLPLTLITGIFSSVIYPSLVKLKKENGDVEGEYYFMLKIIALLNLPIAIILICLPHYFVALLWGKNWMAVADLLPYFGLLVMTQTLISTIGNIMVIENHEKALMYSGWIGAACMIAGIIFWRYYFFAGNCRFFMHWHIFF